MTRSRLLLAIAGVFAGITVVLAVLGVVYSLVLLPVAVPFGATAGLLWYHGTGRLVDRLRRRAEGEARRERRRTGAGPWRSRGRRTGARARRDDDRAATAGSTGRGPTRAEAARLLDVDVDADREAVRRAYRGAVKETHPDAEGGSEERFKRVTAAYERLRED